MAYSPNTYTTNGTDRDYNITFPFLRESDVRVTVFDASGNLLTDSADYDFSIQKPDATFQVRVVQNGTLGNSDGGTALASGSTVTISRVTDISTLVTVFQDGASLRASDINALISQINFALEEFGDNTTSALGKNITQTAWDATSLRITNLAQPTADNDAVRKVDVDSGIGPDITTVAGIASDVTNVAADATDIGVLAADISGTNTIGTVSTNIASVQNVGGSISNVNAVAADAADIGVVAADLGGSDTIGTVAGIASAVASVAADAADIGVVATDLGGSDTIGTVAGIASAVSNVSAISATVASVDSNSTNIATVAGDTSAINTLATGTDSGGTSYLTHLENASTNAAAAQAALTAFNRTYLGAYSADPTVDGNGDALTDGDLYYNTTDEVLKFYNDTDDAWVTLSNSVQVNSASTVGGAGDANFGTLLENDFIVRDGSNPAKWVNKTPAQARTSLGLGTAAVAAASDFATAAQGTAASSALQPNTDIAVSKVVVDSTANNHTGMQINKDDTNGTYFELVYTTSGGSNRTYRLRPPATDSATDAFRWQTFNAHSFEVDDVERLRIDSNGQIVLPQYDGSDPFPGQTMVKSLAVSSSGAVVENQNLSTGSTPEFAGADFGQNAITYSNVYQNIGDLPSASTYHGMFAHVHSTTKGYYAHNGNWIELANQTDLDDKASKGFAVAMSIVF